MFSFLILIVPRVLLYQYYQDITISNSEFFAQNGRDVLVTLDTGSLILDGKMMSSSCLDIAFYLLPGETEQLSYWRESPCGSRETHFWLKVDIPALDSIDVRIRFGDYILRGDQITYLGVFYFFFDAPACPQSWSQVHANGRYIRLHSTPSMAVYGSENHFHSCASGRTSNNNVPYQFCPGSGYTPDVADDGHYHNWGYSSSNSVDNILLHYRMPFCGRSEFSIDASQSMQILFASTVPGDYIWNSKVQNRYPMIDSKSAQSSGGLGAHAHLISVSLSTSSDAEVNCPNTNPTRSYAPVGHAHSSSGNSNIEAAAPPSVDLAFAALADGENERSSFTGMLAFADPAPPRGWQAYSTYNGNFVRGAQSSVSVGVTFGSEYHSHGFSFSTGSASSTISKDATGSSWFVAPTNHYHTISGTTNTAKNEPYHYRVTMYERKTSLDVSYGPVEFVCDVEGCAECSEFGVCARCSAGYVKEDVLCLPCSSDCDVCSSPDVCEKCSESTFLAQVDDDVIRCVDSCGDVGQVVNPDVDSACVGCSSGGCIQCSSPTNCAECQATFYTLIDSVGDRKCVPDCQKLDPAHVAVDGKCEQCSENCALCEAPSLCRNCLNDQFLAEILDGKIICVETCEEVGMEVKGSGCVEKYDDDDDDDNDDDGKKKTTGNSGSKAAGIAAGVIIPIIVIFICFGVLLCIGGVLMLRKWRSKIEFDKLLDEIVPRHPIPETKDSMQDDVELLEKKEEEKKKEEVEDETNKKQDEEEEKKE